MHEKKIIGRKEKITILDLELYDLDAKVDTGADSNALHCDSIDLSREGYVSFSLLDKVHESYHGKRVTLPVFKLKKVRSSNGELQTRPSIQVDVIFFGKKYKTVISLTNRSDMLYPMLIGRKFLSGKFLVDVSCEYVASANAIEEESIHKDKK